MALPHIGLFKVEAKEIGRERNNEVVSGETIKREQRRERGGALGTKRRERERERMSVMYF